MDSFGHKWFSKEWEVWLEVVCHFDGFLLLQHIGSPQWTVHLAMQDLAFHTFPVIVKFQFLSGPVSQVHCDYSW